MRYSGKILGFFLGLTLGGPFGAICGLFIGQILDLRASGYWRHPERRYYRDEQGNIHRSQSANQKTQYNQQEAQQAFFHATFLTMGHIAKADGRVSEDEIRVAQVIMRNMLLNPALKRQAMHLFTQGKQSDFSLENVLQNLFNSCGGSVDLLRMFVDIQFQAAAATGSISQNKRDILQRMCDIIGLDSNEFYIFSQRHQRHYQYSSTHGQQGKQKSYQRQSSGPHTRTATLDDYYKILGVHPGVTNEELKKAYRIKISQNHPDKLVAKGLPEEMIKMANIKTAEIKKAYDTIVASRGAY